MHATANLKMSLILTPLLTLIAMLVL